jgi:hypothetical protein
VLRWLIRGYVLDRLLRALARQSTAGRHPAPRPVTRPGRPRRPVPRAYATPAIRRPRGRGGFAGPFPYYSTRTRRGSQVSVGGCCLPIPLAFLAGVSGLLLRRLHRGTEAGP